MAQLMHTLLPLILAAVQLASALPSPLPFSITVRTELTASSPANIHLSIHPEHNIRSPFTPGESVDVTFGSCDATSPEQSHHTVANTAPGEKRLVWLIPEDVDSEGCLSAWETDMLKKRGVGEVGARRLVGRSERLQIGRNRKVGKRGIVMGKETGIDTSGPWFDGVQLLKGTNLTEVEVEKAKKTRIGIIGAGMSGLMTGLLLDSVNMTNWHILEASQKLGGRVRTKHFEPTGKNYQYQEMGPMRFPEAWALPGSNITLPINDMKLTFDLAAKLNQLNNNDPKYLVKFIPWYQASPNGNGVVYQGGIRLPDGTVPTQGDIIKDPSLKYIVDHGETGKQLGEIMEQVEESLQSSERMKDLAVDMYRTHKKFVDEGWEDWSEFGYIHNFLKASLNVTDLAGAGPRSFWGDLFEGTYFSATQWKTIDKGLQRLPDAFKPLLRDRVSFNRRVSKTHFDATTKKVTVSWKTKFSDKKYTNETFDYAFITAPFSVVRAWRMTPQLPSLISRAILNMPYANACKIALKFKTRFWEHLPKPIYGGCDYNDIPGIQGWCYPSYNINGTGPGVLLASYAIGNWAEMALSMQPEEHVQMVVDAVKEVFGEELVEEQYTGKWGRQCWRLDEFTRGGWADPQVGQHELWIPEYFKTVNNMIFVGEHTSFTHAWIASALESAIRGTVQILLELGLVDEAKQVSKEWMARWIKV